MITTDDVVAAVRVKWQASGIGSLIPIASVYLDRVGEQVNYPYATVNAKLVNRESFAGPTTLVTFDVQVDAYTHGTPSTGAIQSGVLAALDGSMASPSAGLVISGSKVIHSMYQPADGTSITQTRLNNIDVYKASSRFTILAQTLR